MQTESVHPNPKCFISMLQNTWVGWLPELEAPVKLDDARLLALGGAPGLSTPDAIADLLAQGFLLDEAAPFALPHTDIVTVPDSGIAVFPSDFHQVYRINHHLGLQPYAGGLLAYSTQQRCHVLLPASTLAGLAAKGPQEADNGAETSSSAALIDELLKYGFIVQRDGVAAPEVRNNSAVAFARYAMSGVTRELQQRDPVKDLAGRIPIYFAGCIDLAMDMSYGYLNLALGMIMASTRAYEGGRLQDRYYLVPHFLMTPTAVMAAAETYGPGIAFFSNYIWAHEGNLLSLGATQRTRPTLRHCLWRPAGPQLHQGRLVAV